MFFFGEGTMETGQQGPAQPQHTTKWAVANCSFIRYFFLTQAPLFVISCLS